MSTVELGRHRIRALDGPGNNASELILINAKRLTSVAEAHARLGNRDDALKILSELQSSGEKYVSPSSIGFIYASLGDIDESFSWNERAFQESDASLVWLRVAPESDSVRSDARFANLLHRMNFPVS